MKDTRNTAPFLANALPTGTKQAGQGHFKSTEKGRRGAAQLLASKDKASATSSDAKGGKPFSKKRKQPGQSQEVTMIADAEENG